MKKAIVIYCSFTGNTEKVAKSIFQGLQNGGYTVSLRAIRDARDVNFYDYDLICIGVPSINWHIPKPAEVFLKDKFAEYKKEGRIVPAAPAIPGKYALIFCTYSGPHTGIREAIPVVLYMGQFFEHFGFTVVDEWYVLSEFIGSHEHSTLGRMGDIRGLPNEDDLLRIQQRAFNLTKRLF